VSTPVTESFGDFAPGSTYDLLSVLVETNWLREFLGCPLPAVLARPEDPLFLYVQLAPVLIAGFAALAQPGIEPPLRRPYLRAKGLEAMTATVAALAGEDRSPQRRVYSTDELALVHELTEWLTANPTSRVSVPELARRSGLNRNKLQCLFRDVHGRTVAEYQRYLRMTYAHGQLRLGYGAGEVGHRLGYSNLSHFARAFRKYHGYNPSQLKRV
jgi:AraC family transcriptional activator of pyochelin receptor